MATTTPYVFEGTPSIDPAKAGAIYESYVTALADADKATSTEDCAYYDGLAEGYYVVLCVIYGYDPARLEYLRGEIRAERISYAELAELQGLAAFIPEGDVELLAWAGVEEA